MPGQAFTVAKSKHLTLTAGGAIDTVTITDGCAFVEVIAVGAAATDRVYFTVSTAGALTPAIAGDNTFVVVGTLPLIVPVPANGTGRARLVELISTSAIAVAVTGIPA